MSGSLILLQEDSCAQFSWISSSQWPQRGITVCPILEDGAGGQDSGDFGLEMEKLNQACTGWLSRGCLYKDLALLVGSGTTILPWKSFLTHGCCLASAVESTAYLYRKWSLLFAGSVFNPQRFCVCKECEVQIFNLMVIIFEQCTQAFGAFWSALKSPFQLVS